MSKWRPKEWNGDEQAHIALSENDSWLEDEHTFVYEAGADAILPEVLKGVVHWLESGEYEASGLMLPAGWGHELYGYFGLKLPDEVKDANCKSKQ